MPKMKNSILKITAIFGLTTVLLNSCGPKDNPPLVYFPDMYFPVAYDPLMKAKVSNKILASYLDIREETLSRLKSK